MNAKPWMIQQILAEAALTGVPLDALEQQMLEYSETARTPADLDQLNEAFDREHDQQEYEEKIASLIRSLLARLRAEGGSGLAEWKQAAAALRGEDHYLLVMVRMAGGSEPRRRPAHDRLWLVLAAAGAVALIFALQALLTHLGMSLFPQRH